MCRGARGDATRFEHHDALFTEPRGVEKRQRNDGRLSGAGRRLQYGAALLGERELKRGDDVDDWKSQAGARAITLGE
jgi:hypothetical protein